MYLGNQYQWRSQNAEKVTHIKWRLLDQAVVLFNWFFCSKWELLLKERIAPRESEFLHFRAVLYNMEITFTTLGDLP